MWRASSLTASRRIPASGFNRRWTSPSISTLSPGIQHRARRAERRSGPRRDMEGGRVRRVVGTRDRVSWAAATGHTASLDVNVLRLTDFAGLEEVPALSPDGRSVAFTAYVGARRQIWVRLIGGGAALQLTRDDADHEAPRWAPDGASLIYYSPPAEGERQGAIWEVPALGGAPRRIGSAIGGADFSHDGTRVAFFRSEADEVHLVVSSRDGTSSPRDLQAPVRVLLHLSAVVAGQHVDRERRGSSSRTTSSRCRSMAASLAGSAARRGCCPASAGRLTARASRSQLGEGEYGT